MSQCWTTAWKRCMLYAKDGIRWSFIQLQSDQSILWSPIKLWTLRTIWSPSYIKEKKVNVQIDIGYLHHYWQDCASYFWETRDFSKIHKSKFYKQIHQLDAKYCLNAPTEIDRTMWKYKNKLLRQVNQMFQAISQQCHLFWILNIDNFLIMLEMKKQYLPLISCASIQLKKHSGRYHQKKGKIVTLQKEVYIW